MPTLQVGRMCVGHNRGVEQGDYILLYVQSLSSNQYHTDVGMCNTNSPHKANVPLPNGVNPPFITPTHHQPGRVGHNSDRWIIR